MRCYCTTIYLLLIAFEKIGTASEADKGVDSESAGESITRFEANILAIPRRSPQPALLLLIMDGSILYMWLVFTT